MAICFSINTLARGWTADELTVQVLFVWSQVEPEVNSQASAIPACLDHHPAAFVYHNHLQSNNLDRHGIFS